MTCPYCKHRREDEYNFCPNCGMAFNEETYESAYLKVNWLSSEGRIKESIETFQKVIDKGTEHPGVYHDMGHLYYQTGDLDRALEYYYISEKYARHYATLFYDIGETEYRMGKIEKSIESFTRALEHDPNKSLALFWLGLAHYHLGNLDSSIEMFVAVLEKGKGFASAHYHLGVCYFQQENYDQAIEHFKRYYIATKDEKNNSALYYLGLAFVRKGDFRNALKWFQVAVDKNPDDTRAQKQLNMLQDMLNQF